MRYTFKLAEEMIEVAPLSIAPELTLSIGDQKFDVVFDHGRDGDCMLKLNGVEYPSWVARDGDDIHVKMAGRYFMVTAFDPRALASASATSEGGIQAPMPGVVVEVLVAEGDEVTEDTKLMTIESMKLQSTIIASCAGVVKAISVEAGSEFNKDDVLIEIEGA
ncbi:MAG: acetyl-CoA carboxylase biotin carboxyl carrier protein subunit [Spongiibacteraceae bacterium]